MTAEIALTRAADYHFLHQRKSLLVSRACTMQFHDGGWPGKSGRSWTNLVVHAKQKSVRVDCQLTSSWFSLLEPPVTGQLYLYGYKNKKKKKKKTSARAC